MSSTARAAEEIEDLKKNFPKPIDIQAATLDFLTFSYERTKNKYTRVKATLTFPEDYPSHALIVNIMLLPPGLQKKLERELGELARELAPNAQVEAVVQRLVGFIDTNIFVPCWRELRKIVDLLKDDTESTIALQDTKGLIRLRLASGHYYYACSITINPGYPSTTTHQEWGTACKLRMSGTNFPPKIESLLTLQAKELVRRMQDGMSADQALRMSNPIQAPEDTPDKKHVAPTITTDTLKGLQHDMETMARVRDLREVNAATQEGNARLKAHAAKERKDARRTIGKITSQEIAKDEEWQKQEQARMESYAIQDTGDPQPSLLSLVTFLRTKIQRLPEELCPVCKELTLPSDPDALLALYEGKNDNKQARKQARRKRPIRTYCGCWYHYECLDKFMTEPPFGAECPTDGRRVYHPDWPADMKELERAWAKKQARQREIDDAAMFL